MHYLMCTNGEGAAVPIDCDCIDPQTHAINITKTDGRGASEPFVGDLQDTISRLNIWCQSILPDVTNIETDFEMGTNVIRLLRALCPDQPPPDESTYQLPANPTMKDKRKVRAIALQFAFDCGLERRKFSIRSIESIEGLVCFLTLVAITFGKGTNMAIFSKLAELHAQTAPPPSLHHPTEDPGLSAPIGHLPEQPPAPSAALDSFSDCVFRLADFELLDTLGQGSFGEVRRARDPSGRIVAVKSLKPGGDMDERFGFFDREVSVMASVRHPALIRLLGFVPVGNPDGDPPSIVLEFAGRGTLNHMIRANAPPEWDITRCYIAVFGVAVGMMTLHALRIMHRDLKPENVLLDDALEPKVADFGFAKFVPVGASKNHSRFIRTPLYEAPEMLRAEPYTWFVDVYSFGVLFNAVIAREEPYSGMGIRRSFALAAKVMAGTCPNVPDRMRPAWRRLIEKCWDGNSHARPSFDAIVEQMADPVFIGEQVDIKMFSQYQKKVTLPATIRRPSAQS
jgi:hypothetical protein